MKVLNDESQSLTLDSLGHIELKSSVWHTVPKDPIISGLEEMEDSLLVVYKKKVSQVIDYLARLGLPPKGAQYRLITRRSFNAIDLLEYVSRKEKIVDLKMAIYSINYYAALILIGMIDRGRIDHCEILLSNLRNAAYREKEEILKNKFINHPRISLFFANSHAKIASCRTEEGNYYTIEGSGNHAANSRIEQYVIDNDQTIYEFTCKWMSDIRIYLAGKNELVIPAQPGEDKA